MVVQRGFLKMALYSGGDSNAEFVSCSRTSSDPSPTLECGNRGVLNGYPNITIVNHVQYNHVQ